MIILRLLVLSFVSAIARSQARVWAMTRAGRARQGRHRGPPHTSRKTSSTEGLLLTSSPTQRHRDDAAQEPAGPSAHETGDALAALAVRGDGGR